MNTDHWNLSIKRLERDSYKTTLTDCAIMTCLDLRTNEGLPKSTGPVPPTRGEHCIAKSIHREHESQNHTSMVQVQLCASYIRSDDLSKE